MNSFFPTETESVLNGNYSRPFGLGYESELIEKACKAQIVKYLAEITGRLQDIWDKRDREFIEETKIGSYSKITIPHVKPENIHSGIEVESLINAPLDRWPTILVYARNSTPYSVQEDQFDTVNIPLIIEVLCTDGPVKESEIRAKKGLELMENLNSKLQRLSDAVYLCIKKDPSLSGTIGEIEKPSKVTTSLPWARKENKDSATGESFFFQGKQFDFSVQKVLV